MARPVDQSAATGHKASNEQQHYSGGHEQGSETRREAYPRVMHREKR